MFNTVTTHAALIYLGSKKLTIDQFPYVKIQPKTIDLDTRLWGINPTNSEVYCFRLNFNISKVVYC